MSLGDSESQSFRGRGCMGPVALTSEPVASGVTKRQDQGITPRGSSSHQATSPCDTALSDAGH